jgi:hypothetical protein
VNVEQGELTEVVGRLTGGGKPGRWKAKKLYEPVASATAGIWRISGVDWSVVLKLVHHGDQGHPNWMSSTEPSDWNYWKREVLAYEAGIPDSLTGGLRGPEVLGIYERADGSVALWLEDVGAGSAGTSWTVADYGSAARQIGRAQGGWSREERPRSEAWFSNDWLRAYLAQRDGDMELLDDPGPWAWPLVRDNLIRDTRGPMRRMRDDQALFLDALDRMPPTLCHFDLHPANLFSVGEETVLIDWAFVGIGALGEDAAVLVADAVLDFHVEPAAFDDLFEVVKRGYAEGLEEAGWSGATQLVERGMNATMGARYAWIGPALLRSVIEERSVMNRRPIAETARCWGQTIPFLLEHAEAARQSAAGQAPRVRQKQRLRES